MTQLEQLEAHAWAVAREGALAYLDAASSGGRTCIEALHDVALPHLRLAAGLPADGRPTELTLKQWLYQESERTGRAFKNVQSDFYRGKFPHLTIRRDNSRRVWVVL